jgi:hypothetical protein
MYQNNSLSSVSYREPIREHLEISNIFYTVANMYGGQLCQSEVHTVRDSLMWNLISDSQSSFQLHDNFLILSPILSLECRFDYHAVRCEIIGVKVKLTL